MGAFDAGFRPPITDGAEEQIARLRRGKKPKAWQLLRERGITGIQNTESGGLVSAPVAATGTKRDPGATPKRTRLAATPAPKKDRVFGSRRNAEGSAASGSGSIDIDQSTEAALKEKVRTHNEAMRKAEKPEWSRVSLGDLKAVYRRGAGAFSTSHRPGMTRGRWAMGRVNAYLEILSNGKPDNARYVTDNDLLPSGHPWKDRVGQKALIPFGKGKKTPKPAPFKPDAIDGNSDGMVQDGTTQERPATGKPGKIISSGKPKKPFIPAPSVGKNGGSGGTPQPPKPPKPWPPVDREKKKVKWTRPLLGQLLLGRPETTSYALRKKDGRYIRPRRELHRNIVGWFIGRAGKPKPEGERTIYFMGGGPSTGKTTALKSGVTGIPSDVLRIDTDEIKEFLPEYREWVEWGIGSAAHLTQDESKHVSQLVSQALIDHGGDFVYDTTGDGNYKGFRERLEALRANGHRIVGHYMTNDLELALRLNEERFKATGRKVPESNVTYIHQQVSRNIPQALRDGLFDELYLYDTNDLEKGPRLILSHKNGVTRIHDAKAYRAFLKKGETPQAPKPEEGAAVTKPGGVWQPQLDFSAGKPRKPSTPSSTEGKPRKPSASSAADEAGGPFDDPPVNPKLPAPYGPKKDKP